MSKLWLETQDAVNRAVAPNASITGAQITAGLGSAHSWQPIHNGNLVSYCRGASLLNTGTTGLLAVHLINDPAGVWYLLSLTAGAAPLLVQFDLVGDSTVGTTVTLDGKLYIYPAAYTFADNTTGI